jgi:hypothetical protein
MQLSLVSDYSLIKRLTNAKREFKGSRFESVVNRALEFYCIGDFERSSLLLEELPRREKLLGELIEKLEGKPVYKTLEKISKGRSENEWETLKGLFSLGTHICIELEKGNYEYRGVLADVYERIGRIMYEVSVV